MIVAGKEQTLNVTTHILQSDSLNPLAFKLFHCYVCGTGLMKSNQREIWTQPDFGRQEFIRLTPPVIIECRRCKENHLFASII